MRADDGSLRPLDAPGGPVNGPVNGPVIDPTGVGWGAKARLEHRRADASAKPCATRHVVVHPD